MIVKAELFVLAALTVTLAPLAFSVPDAEPLVPVATFPNESVAGDTVKIPTLVTTPAPDTGIVSVGFVAVEVMVRFPLKVPAAFGSNEIVKLALCPVFKVRGVVIPLTLKPVPVIPT